MRPTLEDAEAYGIKINVGLKLARNIEALTAEKTLNIGDATMQVLDPGGGDKDVLLPAEASSDGLVFLIKNTADAAESLIVKEDSDTTTIGTVAQNEAGLFFCDGTTWYSLVGGIT